MLSPKLSAGEVCTRIVVVVLPSLAVEEAARLMRDEQVGSLVVVEEAGPQDRQVVGVLTDRDIAIGVVANQAQLPGLSVADLMSRDVVTAREEDSVLDVLATMRRKAVRRVPVVGPQQRLIGILTIDDLLAIVAEQMQALAEAVGRAQRHEQLTGR
jgi:CBS domain-containing protein